MKLNPGLLTSVRIFKDLGWNDAPREQAPTLPLGTKEQQREALAGLKTGEWGEFGKLGANTYGWISAIDVDAGMLALFAIRLGVDARRGESLASGDDRALVECLKQRGEKYALAFIARACRSNRRMWEHSLSVFGATAVALVCELSLDVPDSVEYLKDWAAIALPALTGDRSEVPGDNREIPGMDDLRPSFEAHLQAAIDAGLPTTGPFGRVLPAAAKQGFMSRDQALAASFAGLDAAVRPGDRKALAQIITDDLEVTDDELVARTDALIPLLSTAEAPMIEAFAPRLIANVPDHLVGEVALTALYAKTAKAVRSVLAALTDRGAIGPISTELLADRVGELASGRDKATAKIAGALLASWDVARPAAEPGAPEVRGLWQPTPPLWQVPRFDAGEPSAAALTEAFRPVVGREEFVHDLETDRFLALAVALADVSLDEVRRALAGAPRDFWSGGVRRWLDGKPVLPEYRRDNIHLHHEMVLEHLGKIPCLLSEPSWDDLSVDYADLVARLQTYADFGLPVLHTDLVLALSRVDVAQADDRPLPGKVGVKLDDGSLLDRDAATVITEYLADPFVEPDLLADPHSAMWRAQVVSWPNSLLGIPQSIRHEYFNRITPGQLPHWGDAAMTGLWWTGEIDYRVGSIALQVARRAVPITAGGAMNLLAVQRPSKPEIAEQVAQALTLAWERGLLVPGVADLRCLDWRDSLMNVASLTKALVEVAETGMLSVVWPVLDDLLTASQAQPRMVAGTAEVAEAMELFVGEVVVAVASGVAPDSALDVPGLRALAAHGGSSKAVVAARAAVKLLPERKVPEAPATPALSAREFEANWPESAGKTPRIEDGVRVTADWPVTASSARPIRVNLYLPDRPGEVFQVVLGGWVYGLSHEGQTRAMRVVQGEVGEEVWLHWDGSALVATEYRNRRENKHGPLTGGPTPLSDALIALLVANLATEIDAYGARGAIERLAEADQLSAASVSAAVRALAPHEAWSPARAVYELESNPRLLPSLWPMLTETLRYAAAQDTVPRWANRVLDIVKLHAQVLAEATRRGYLPPDAWAGVRDLASKKGNTAAIKKAKELLVTLG